jgi:hypothetical protein
MHVEEPTDSEIEVLFSSNGWKRASKKKKVKM